MTLKNITIESESQGQRLDKFLTAEFTDLSRSRIQKMIKAGDILVNGQASSVHHFLKTGDKIEINQQTTKPEIKEEQETKASDRRLFKKIKIIEQDKNFLIIEKPAGLLVHPTTKNETDTLVDWLIEQFPEIKKIGEDPSRPGIVHRLDRDVSGLMIIPLNQESFDYFKHQFKEHTIIKKYFALVHGRVEKDEDEINFPIGRSKNKDGLYAAHPQQQGENLNDKDKKAITTFEVKKRYINHALLEVEIFTGRTHQIRVHLLAYGNPIVGDPLYQSKKQNLRNKKETNRIFLHAGQLEFIDPEGRTRKFSSDLPETLQLFLDTLPESN